MTDNEAVVEALLEALPRLEARSDLSASQKVFIQKVKEMQGKQKA